MALLVLEHLTWWVAVADLQFCLFEVFHMILVLICMQQLQY